MSYAVTSAYRGKTLLAIVQGCMGGHRSQSSSESRWRNGFCTIGTQTAVSGLSGTGNLRIGVGDSASGSSDSGDWALFMPLSGNGRGDYSGSSIWAFGSEMRANTGYNGAVYIESGQGAQAAHAASPRKGKGKGVAPAGSCVYTKQSTVGKCAWPTRFALVGGLHGAARFELHGAIMRDRAADQGGAIAASGDTHLDISRSTFVSNIAIVVSGGVNVSSGDDSDPMGGAISASGGTMSITNSEFTDNRAAKGGAIYTSGILTIVAAAFSGNKATVTASGHGGGAIVINGGTLSVTLSTFSNNQASGSGTAFGGAIASISGGTVTITTTKFSCSLQSNIIPSQSNLAMTMSNLPLQ